MIRNEWAKWLLLPNGKQIAILEKYYKYGYTGRNILISDEGTIWRTIEPYEIDTMTQTYTGFCFLNGYTNG